MIYNAQKLIEKTPSKDASGASLQLPIDTCVLFCDEGMLKKLMEPPKERAAAPEKAKERFEDCRTKLERSAGWDYPLMRGYVESNGISNPLTLAFFSGDGEFLHQYDAAFSRLEGLLKMQKGDKQNGWEILSTQMIGCRRSDERPGPVKLTSVSHDLQYGKNDDLVQLTSQLTLETMEEGLRTIPLALWNSRDPDNPRWDAEKHRITLKGVVDENGKEVPFIHKYDEVLLFLDGPKPKHTQLHVTSSLEGDFQQTSDRYFTLLSGAWFPQPLSYSSSYTSHIKVRSRKPYRPILSGAEISSSTDGKEYVVESEEKKAVGLASIVCGNYQGAVTDENGLRIGVWSFAEKAPGLDQLNKFARQIVDTYSKAFAPYPFSELNIVEAFGWGYGHAHAGMIFVSREAFISRAELHDRKALTSWLDSQGIGYFEDSILSTRGVNALFAHEISHQWWGETVQISKPEDLWLIEAFAEYSAFLLVKRINEDIARRTFKDWTDLTKHSADKCPLYMANFVSGKDSWRIRAELLYGRGPMMLHAIAREIGQARLANSMAALAEWKNMSTATSEDFLRVLNKMAGRDLTGLYNKWLYETALPELPPYDLAPKK